MPPYRFPIRFDRDEMRQRNGQCTSIVILSTHAEQRRGQKKGVTMHGNVPQQGTEPLGDHTNDAMLGERFMRGPTTWQVRRAEQYIESHWDQPITIEILARATAASARSIFQHFKSCRGQSPMSFLKQLRLQHAREMLERTDLNRSVTDTAIACGFGNLGHFAGAYFERYGERPSETLKRGKFEFISHH